MHLVQIFPSKMRFLYTSRASRYLIGAFPKLSQWVIAPHKKAMVVNVGSDGKIIRGFDDCNAPDFRALRPEIRSATRRRIIISKIKQKLTKCIHTKFQQKITICRSLKILKYNLITYHSKFTD